MATANITKLKRFSTRYFTGFLKPNLKVIVFMTHWFPNQSSAFRSDMFWMWHNTVFDRWINVDRCILRWHWHGSSRTIGINRCCLWWQIGDLIVDILLAATGVFGFDVAIVHLRQCYKIGRSVVSTLEPPSTFVCEK